MSWAILIPLITQYGLPFVQHLWSLFQNGTPPTEADWAELRKLAAQTANSQMVDALTRAGIPLDSPQAMALLGLTK